MSRFDYVKYDEAAQLQQEGAKTAVQLLENVIIAVCNGQQGRAASLAMTKLEECYMWIGKMIRDHQIARSEVSGEQVVLQEERTNS